jgi:hypothetical protein
MDHANVIGIYTNGSNAIKLVDNPNDRSRSERQAELVEFQSPKPIEHHYAIKTFAAGAIALALVVASVFMFAYGDAIRRDSAVSRTDFEEITVSAGDSLWTISENRPIDGISISEEVFELKKLNGLDTSEITAGQKLMVPITIQ